MKPSGPWRGSAAFLLGISLIACSGSSPSLEAASASIAVPTAAPTASPLNTPSGSATATASPTARPTADLSALGRLYLAAATELNAKLTSISADLEAATTADEQAAAYSEYASAFKAATEAIDKETFPATIQADIDELLSVYKILQQVYEKLADDPGLEVGDAVTNAGDQVKALASRIRAALGLPPPPSI